MIDRDIKCQLINWKKRITGPEAGSQVIIYFADESIEDYNANLINLNGTYTKQENTIQDKPVWKNESGSYIFWWEDQVSGYWVIGTYTYEDIGAGYPEYGLGNRFYYSTSDTTYPYEVALDGWQCDEGNGLSPYVVFEAPTFYNVTGTVISHDILTPETTAPEAWSVFLGIFNAESSGVDGSYTLQLPAGTSGVIAPAEGYWTTTPESYTISNISGNLSGKDFNLGMNYS